MLNEKFNIPKKIKIIAVSKLQPLDKIKQLISEGHSIFGENYVQEAIDKMEQLKDHQIEWHFIGSLQKNKVKMVVGNFAYIHSVDSISLAEKINQVAKEKGLKQKIFIQINAADELSKGGILPSELPEFVARANALENIEIVGLMTMPPLTENPEQVRPYFQQLKILGQQCFRQPIEYSMGTSHDYLVAVSEGATMIRLGTILFGERPRRG